MTEINLLEICLRYYFTQNEIYRDRSKTGHLSDKTQMFQCRITLWLVAVLVQKNMGYSLVIN